VAEPELAVVFVDEECNALAPMAARLAADLGGSAVQATSAGTRPDGRILPSALTALREVGVDTTDLVPSPVSRAELEAADVVVAIGLGDDTAVAEIEARRWDVAVPGGQLAAFREARDELALRVRELLREHGVELDEVDVGYD
jgi:protein-tyrosine-phosphatase